jgi:hypothetical protein
MARWSLPTLRHHRHQGELEALLDTPRSEAPAQQSINVLVPALQKILDRQFSALEALDRKAAVMLGAILGLGFLTSDRLQAPDGWAALPFWIALAFGLIAIGACLLVLWSRPLLTGPKPVPSAQATGWTELPFSQSVADSLAVAAQENASVNVVKGNWLNIAFIAATIAVLSFAILGVMEGGVMTDQQPGQTPQPSATASSTTTPTTVPPTETPTSSPSSQPSPPAEGGWVHPRLSTAELRESWDPSNNPQPAPPPPPQYEGGENA